LKYQLRKGEQQIHHYQVKEIDIAAFESGVVHRVCSTFALAREMEWSSRMLVLIIKEEQEEGIGTELHIKHLGPAFINEKLQIVATVLEHSGSNLLCSIEVTCAGRLIASGSTGQKIIPKTRLAQLLTPASNG
jgi:fluoroacetyl-CoA thioesterase